ncbi:LamG domain-containing protein [Actinoplanes sp. NPDC049265]|uniref:LamG domain-containing protein n=1 Tax=Actinoplanes sp. NPDC049265 TaxID=3363902 RepID=UPI003722674D
MKGLLAAALLCLAIVVVHPTGATFTGTTTGAGSAGAAATFPTYPQQVVSDHPSAYYRLNDAVSATTAADSSGNGNTGAFAPPVNTVQALYLPFDDGSGTVARDLAADGSPADGTLIGGATWGAGRAGGAFTGDGTSAYVNSAATVDTRASFTVSAWVYLTNTAIDGLAVSQRGTNTWGYALGYDGDTGKWVFTMPRTDVAAPASDTVASSSAAVANTWQLLVATFNAGTGKLQVWLADTSVGTANHTTTFNATNGTTVGVGWAGAFAGYWNGRIDDVRVLPGLALTASTISGYVNGLNLGAAAQWRFDENTGTTVRDAAGAANRGTLGAGTSWTTGHLGAAAQFNGSTDAYATGSAPAVDSTGSFTVSAWAYLDVTGADRTVASQAGATSSPFLLGYVAATGKWQFALTSADAANPTVTAAVSSGAAATGVWTHLTGVYDDVADQIRIYVNGAAGGTASFAAPWSGTGAVNAGRMRWNGGYAGNWQGRIDELRFYRRALTAAEVTRIYGDAQLGTFSLGTSGALDGAQQGQQAATAAAFTGVRNGYDATQLVNPTTFTVECWFRADVPGPAAYDGTLINFAGAGTADTATGDGGRRLILDTAGNVTFALDTTAAGQVRTSGTSYLDARWHHVAATLDSGTGMRLYVDGVLAATKAYLAPPATSGYWRWGGDARTNGWTTDYFVGSLDEVAFYPAALSAQQISWHFHADH